jgi:hypothetical protein
MRQVTARTQKGEKMNYYKTTNIGDESVDVTIIPRYPMVMTYHTFLDKAHDSLMECSLCGIKHDFFTLTKVGIGKFACKFCIKGAV